MLGKYLIYQAGKSAGQRDRQRKPERPATAEDMVWMRFFLLFWPTLVIIVLIVKSL